MIDNQKVTRIVLRHDTSENWVAINPVLLKGEMALELLENGSVKMKIGNGTAAWQDLAYASTGSPSVDPEGGASSAEVEELKNRVAELEANLNNQASKFDSIDALIEANTASITTVQEELNKLAAQDKLFDAALEVLQEQANNTSEKIDILEKDTNANFESLTEKINTNENIISTLSETTSKLEADVITLGTINSEIQLAVTANTDSISTLQEDVGIVKTDLETAKNNISDLSSSLEATNLNVENVAASVGTLTASLEETDKALETFSNSMDGRVTELETNLTTTNTTVATLNSEIEEIKAQIEGGDLPVPPSEDVPSEDFTNLVTRVDAHDSEISTIKDANAAHLEEYGIFVTETNNKIEIVDARVDNLITDSVENPDAELQDIRTGYDGTIHSNAGNAVRQIGYDLKALHDELEDFIGANAVDGLAYENNMLWLTAKGVQVGDAVEVIGGTGGGSGSGSSTYFITLLNELSSRVLSVAEGDPVVLKFSYHSIDDDGYPDGPGIGTITVNNVRKASISIPQGSYTLDATKFLVPGENTIRIKVENSEGSSKTLAYTVNVLALAVTTTVPDMGLYSGSVGIPYTVTGQGQKTVYFVMDGRDIGSEVVETSGMSRTFSIPQQTDGAHVLEIYAVAESEGSMVRSDVLQIGMLYTSSTMTDAAVLMLKPATLEVSQGETLTLPYMVYDPFTESAEITLTILDKDGNVYGNPRNLTVDRAAKIWTTQDYPAGNIQFQISCGEAYSYVSLKVEPSTFNKTVITDACVLDFNAAGRNNGEKPTPEHWEYNGIEATFEGFGWSNVDGWIDDVNGQTALRFLPGNTMNIPFYPFSNENDLRVTGYTIEAELATHNVRDYDSIVISSMDDGRGFMIKSQQADLKSEQSAVTVQFREDTRVRVTFVVEQRTLNRFVYVYINGIMCGVTVYPEGDNFNQVNPTGITIGAESCGLDLYVLRIYKKGLTEAEQLNNFICDRPTLVDRIAADERNDILSKQNGEVTIQDLPMTIPYMIIECEELPQFKGDKKKKKSVTFVDQMHPERNFTAEGVQLDVQGTSSAGYPVKNYKVSLKEGLTYTNSGEHSDGFPIFAGGLPGEVICLKADYASSENANNVMLVDFYESICPYKTPPQEEDGRVRQGIRGFACVVFWNNTETGETTFIGKYNFNDDKSNENVFGFDREKYPNCECWEFCNNTSNRVIFKESEYESTVTVTNPDGSTETYPAWYDDFEARFPDLDDPFRDYTNFKRMTDWVVSTDREAVDTEEEKAARLQKFKDEFEQYFVKEPCLFYYLFTEVFLMVDNRAKNLFLTTFDGNHWFPIPYDMDTAIGINNEGALVFNYDCEDTDTVNGADVFNGQHSTLWCNIRDAFGSEIQDMYVTLRSGKKFAYDVINSKMADHQATWPEVLWNEDAKKKWLSPYINQKIDHLDMLQGDKKAQRDWWLFNDFRYRDSKYQCGDANTNYITLRAYDIANITVTPYADIWPRIKYGSNVTTVRGKRNNSYELECTLDKMNDTEIYIYSADRIASVGDLSSLKVGMADFAAATKLTEVIVGNGDDDYENPNLYSLSVGNNELLTLINVQNCTNPEFVNLDASGCHGLETVLAKNTKLTGINLPNGGHLHTLELPATIANLTIQNQKNLTTMNLASQENISTLHIENTPGLDIENLILNSPKLNRVRLTSVEWTATSEAKLRETVEKLANCAGLDASGANTAQAVVTGRVHVDSITEEFLQSINDLFPELVVVVNGVAKFYIRYFNYDYTLLHRYIAVEGTAAIDPIEAGYIDQPKREDTEDTRSSWRGWSELPTEIHKAYNIVARYNNTYRVQFKSVADKVLNEQWVDEGGEAREPVSSKLIMTPSKPSSAQYDYVWNGWDRDYTEILAPMDFYPTFESILRKYLVRFFNDSILLHEDQVYYGDKANYPGNVNEIKKYIGGEVSDYYEFASWSPSPDEPIHGAVDFKAQFLFDGYIEDSWEQIIEACRNGDTSAYGLGGRKIIEYTYTNGKTYQLEMEIVGKNHDNLAETDPDYNGGTNKAAITFISKDTVPDYRRMNATSKTFEGNSGLAAGGWEYSDQRSWMNSTFYGCLPENVRTNIKPVIKISDYGKDALRLNEGTVDTLWIPSDRELNGENTHFVIAGQGEPYPVFIDNASRQKTNENNINIYWSRSTCITGIHLFRYVDVSGNFGNLGGANSASFAVGFCI